MRMNRFMITVAIVSTVSGATELFAQNGAGGIPSPGELIKRVEAESKNSTVKSNQALKQHAKQLQDDLPRLSEEEAARRWLALFEEEAETPFEPQNSWRSEPDQTIMKALPAPATWVTLNKMIESRTLPEKTDAKYRREVALKYFGRLLINDTDWVKAHINELISAYSASDESTGYMRTSIQDVDEFKAKILGVNPDTSSVIEQIAAKIKSPAENTYDNSLELPDLVTIAGPTKAEELLRLALVSSKVVTIEVGDDTRKLAQKLAVELVAQLKVPQWQLVTVDSPELYEALDKQFATPTTQPSDARSSILSSRRRNSFDPSSFTRIEADKCYWLSLVISGKSDQAIEMLKKHSADAQKKPIEINSRDINDLITYAPRKALYDTIYKMISANPDLPIWDLYRQLAVQTGKTDEMLALSKSLASQEKLSNLSLITIRTNLAKALLAADRVDEAIETYRQLLKDKAVTNSDRIEIGISIARLGRVLKNKGLLDEGLQSANDAMKADGNNNNRPESSTESLIYLLSDSGRDAEAMDLIGHELARVSVATTDEFRYSHSRNKTDLLCKAASIYGKVGRHADVLELMKTVPGWGATDLKDIITRSTIDSQPVGLVAARAMLETGNKDGARKVLLALLNSETGYDPAYDLLIKIDGPAALDEIEKLAAIDRFQERPLIWKGEILRTQGKLDEAEKIIRQAIAIDPSDGEQPHGDRMRVYAVLAAILHDKKDEAQSETYRKVVSAIRMSEQADDLYAAGLLKQSIDLYEDSLKVFVDAYCIQSRLAIKLMEMGNTEEADKHFQKAFELMPDSFSRVESHCFGCEKAFAGKSQQSIAERVFIRLLLEKPEKPQLHYLMGYLREEQSRNEEALSAYKTAVKYDPDYLNAWKHISSLSSHIQFTQADLDTANLAIFRLDPRQKHASARIEKIHALKELYEVVASAPKPNAEDGQSLMPLAQEADSEKDSERTNWSQYSSSDDIAAITPGEALARTDVIKLIREMMMVAKKRDSTGH